MPVFSSDQIKCCLVLEDAKYQKTGYRYSFSDGEPVPEKQNIDIGQKEWPYSYPGKVWPWKFLDNTPDMRGTVQRRALQVAFNSVEKLTNLKVVYEKDVNKKTQGTVEWKEDIETFDGRLSVIAHAYLWQTNSSKNGVMEFNDSPESKYYFTPLGHPVEAYLVDSEHYKPGERWPDGRFKLLASISATHVGMHEFGHILGLPHDLLHQESIMAPYAKRGHFGLNRVNKNAFEWQANDVARLESRYGKSGIPTRWLRRWQARRVMRQIYER